MRTKETDEIERQLYEAFAGCRIYVREEPTVGTTATILVHENTDAVEVADAVLKAQSNYQHIKFSIKRG